MNLSRSGSCFVPILKNFAGHVNPLLLYGLLDGFACNFRMVLIPAHFPVFKEKNLWGLVPDAERFRNVIGNRPVFNDQHLGRRDIRFFYKSEILRGLLR